MSRFDSSVLPPIQPHPGDVYIINDNCRKKKGDQLNTHLIRYSRPVVVISSVGTIATVIPCTTNDRWKDTSYPLRLSPTKISYALLSQVKTVDISSLDHEMGKLRPVIFNDLRQSYVKYLGSSEDIKRSIKLTRNLDIKIFHPWHIYTDKSFEKFYLVFRTAHRIYAIRAYLPTGITRETMDYLDGTFMRYDPEELYNIGRKMAFTKNLEPVGIELDQTNINRISFKLRALYGFDIDRGCTYDYNLKAFCNFMIPYGGQYIPTYKFISEIPDDIVFSDNFTDINTEYYLDKIESDDGTIKDHYLTIISAIGKSENKVPLNYIRQHRFSNIEDIRALPPACINWMIDNMLKEFVDLLLDQYMDMVEKDDDGKYHFKPQERLKNFDLETLSIIENFIYVMLTKV